MGEAERLAAGRRSTASGPDYGTQVAVDAKGNVYLAGFTQSPDFQTTPGAAFPAPSQSPGGGGSNQVFVQKLSPGGVNPIYSTYLGLGVFNSNHPLGMRVDASGNVYLAAMIFNNPLPVTGTPIDPNGIIGVYKVAPGGDHLIYATQVQPGFDYTMPVALAIDSSGYAYVASGDSTLSLSKIDPTGMSQLFSYQTVFSKYPEGIADIAVGPDESIYIAGTTAQGGLATTPGAMTTMPTSAAAAGPHGFLMRIKADGSGPIYSTYIAGTQEDGIYALTVDASGAAYVGGYTFSLNANVNGQTVLMPGIQGTLLGIPAVPLDISTAFVMKVDPAGDAAGFSALLPGVSVSALALDSVGNLYAAGVFNPGGGSTNNTSDYLNTAGVNIEKIDPSGSILVYYSAIPTINDPPPYVSAPVVGLAVDSNGEAYLAGSSASLKIPEPHDIASASSHAYVLGVNAAPDQCDLQVTVQSIPPTYVPGSNLTAVFNIQNNGPSTAQDVVFSIPAKNLQNAILTSCQATGSGICSLASQNPTSVFIQAPRVEFDSLAPGASVTVTVTFSTYVAPDNMVATAVVSTSTSDVNQNNNTATAISLDNGVPITVRSSLSNSGSNPNLQCAISGSAVVAPAGLCSGAYVAANTQFQITWPSPQATNIGGYPAIFQQWSDGSTDNPRTFTATGPMNLDAVFELLIPPFLSSAGVTSAASYASNGVSPGEIIALFGFNLGASSSGQVQNGAFTTQSGSTTVMFDGTAAPIIYVSGMQSSVVVPYEVAGKNSTTITIETAGGSATAGVPVVPAVPALFTANSSGTGQASALNQDGTVNSFSNPASAGQVIVLYGTGEGLVQPVPADGTITTLPEPVPALPITVDIGGQPAQIIYAAEAPSLVSGVIQINAVIPNGISSNAGVPVTWKAGTYSSQPGVTIAVQ